MAQLSSVLTWFVGAVGLLVQGGTPRVTLVTDAKITSHLSSKLANLPMTPKVTVKFGSLIGSNFVPDKGTCTIDRELVKSICRMNIKCVRDGRWIAGMLFYASMLLLSIVLQIGGSAVATVWSEVMVVGILLLTSVCRGYGVAGPEIWQIPSWIRRPGAYTGAILVGQRTRR